MISFSSAINTNIDQSAIHLQHVEKPDKSQQIDLGLSSGASENKEQQNGSGHFSGRREDKNNEQNIGLYSRSDTISVHKKQSHKDSNESHFSVGSGESRLIEELRKRDIEVKQHEQAHAAAGGKYAGSPQYQYETGPDGRRYAVEGEVSVNTSSSGDPKDKMAQARTIRMAALAPSEPSTQDRRVAAEALRMTMEAQTELVKLKAESKAEKVQKAEEKPAADELIFGESPRVDVALSNIDSSTSAQGSSNGVNAVQNDSADHLSD